MEEGLLRSRREDTNRDKRGRKGGIFVRKVLKVELGCLGWLILGWSGTNRFMLSDAVC